MNRTLKTLVSTSLIAMLTSWSAAAESAPGGSGDAWPRLQVAHSWFANSHSDARFMPQGIEGMYISPDGTTFTNIFWEEGGGNVAVIGTDGDVHPRPHMPGYFGWGHNGGKAVAANSKYAYFSQQYNNEGGEVFVACAIDNSIRVYDAEEMTLKRSWEVKNAWHIALDGEGALWVAIGENATEILRYDAQGKRLPQTITLPPGSRSGSFCIDPTGRMLIGDVAENEWVLIYSDITTAPKPAGNFGTRKGIFSGTPGALGPLKFSQVRGIGVDAEGSIYIANTQSNNP